jgi:DNA-binding GntR family transcriptional regulator
MSPVRSPFAKLPELNRATLTEEAARSLRLAILSGEIPDGQQLTESRISKEFNISRAPVREALQQLVSQGLVTHYPHRGYFLRTFSVADIEDLSLLRIALERLAMRLAIERGSEAETEALDTVVGDMERAVADSSDGVGRAVYFDYDFHRKLCAMSHHKPLISMWSSMQDQISAAIRSLLKSFPRLVDDRVVQSHRVIAAALRARDVNAACDIIEKHVSDGVAMLKQHAAQR